MLQTNPRHPDIPQYSLGKIILVWSAAALPMGFLGWIVAPALAADPARPGFERLAVLTVGLIWQCAVVLFLVLREAGNLRWSTLKTRLWLGQPVSPRTGVPSRRLWWWLIPLVAVTAVYQMKLGGYVGQFWTNLFPFLDEPPGWSLAGHLDTPEGRAGLVGAWDILGLFVVSAIFNTVIGEELLFRGLLLPRMNGVFGRRDWVVNGLMFGLYHVHQPWGMLSLGGLIFFSLPTRLFRCAWFGIVAHSGQSVFFIVLILGLVLGLA